MHFVEKLGHSKKKNSMGILSSLTREQKEAVGLLQIGTFLEYFDLMLYVHMAVLLNELFFPKTDPQTAALLSAFAFCSTYVLRPFGALFFGWLGDNIGRKSTVIITTMMMSISCIVIASLPTYAQIGVSAAWIITICRVLQGLSSMGEIIGAEIYLTEITKPPTRYPVVSLVAFASALGTTVALLIASLFTSFEFNWRIAFWIGAAIAVVGSIARTRLRETSDFLDIKNGTKGSQKKFINLKKQSISYFLMGCSWPACFYFSYIHCGLILKNQFSYTAEQVIYQNFLVSIVGIISCFLVSLLSYKIHPLKITRIRFFLFFPFILFYPFILKAYPYSSTIFFIQIFSIGAALSVIPAASVIIMYFPAFRRFTYTSYIYALSRASVYILTSFGFVYLTNNFGEIGILFIMIPISISILWGVNHFIKLEKASGNFPSSKKTDGLIIKC